MLMMFSAKRDGQQTDDVATGYIWGILSHMYILMRNEFFAPVKPISPITYFCW